jgi:chromosomal replication initiator protein
MVALTAEKREKFFAYLKTKVKTEIVETFKNLLEPKQKSENEFYFEVPSEFYKSWAEKEFTKPLQDAFQTVFGSVPHFQFVVSKTRKQPEQPPPPEQDLPASIKTTRYYLFRNFVGTKSNRYALSAAQQVAFNPAQIFNPLYIYGKTGTGKTHLLKAIQYEVQKLHPGKYKTLYITADEFVTKFLFYLNDLRQKEVFRNAFRQADVLLFDDLQVISTKKVCQEEFIRILNDYLLNQKQIVVASKLPPWEIDNLKEDIVSRLQSGPVIKIVPPDAEEQLAILKIKAKEIKRDVPDEVLKHLVNLLSTSDVRRLEGAFVNIVALSALSGEKLDVEFVEKNIHTKMGRTKKFITIGEVAKVICKYFKIEQSDLKSQSRVKSIVYIRHLFSHLARNLTNCSFSEIAMFLGKKSKAVVANSLSKAQTLLEKSQKAKEDYANLLKLISQ